VAEEQWYEVIRHGLKVLTVNPWDLQTLSAMATAAGRMGHRECELYYLKSALAANSKDPNINRQCAMLMTDLGQYDQAIVCWHRVEEALPDAEEPRRAIAVLLLQRSHSRGEFGHDDVKLSTQVQDKKEELSPEQILKRKIEKEPDQLAHYQELADFYIAQDHFREAEAVLAKAYRVSNEDPEVRDKWQDTQLRYLRQTIAKTHDLEKKKKYQRAYFEKELEVFKNRVERYPDNLSFKYELGYRYFLTKHYAEAIKELQAAKNDPRRKGVSLLALGQCFQHIKQFRLAMQHYEQALEEIPDRDPDNKKKSLYFAGRLALVLGDLETAESHLSNLAALDFTYNNVSALLDKIAKLRENPDQAEHHDETPDHNQGDS
jgi:tetratricopeptide (TPR) repeat protein